MRKTLLVAFLVTVFLHSTSSSAFASHSWGYHWNRSANPFGIKLGDNLSPAWDPYLQTTSSDWSQSSVLDTSIIAGSATPRTCRPRAGQVEVCNYRYGNNGWLGIAQVWTNNGHITQGTVKVNDTYYNQAIYNTPAWKNLVMCQEVGHTLGLDHQDENMTNPNLGTCMDYSNDPTSNQHPNAHDYGQLETIYAHPDPAATPAPTRFTWGRQQSAEINSPSDWGQLIRSQVRSKLFEKDFGDGNKVYTFVTSAN